MNVHTLSKTTTKGKRRLGQGHGSGRVKTAGRGTKGQKARTKVPLFFEGGALPLIKRMPFLRGKGKNNSFAKAKDVLNVTLLNVFGKGQTVDVQSLQAKKLIPESVKRVKILGDGELNVSLTVKVPVSKGARVKIEKAGGQVVSD